MQIDIKEIVKSKNPSLYRKIPNFLFWIAKKILYEKSINKILKLHSHLRGVEFTRATLDELNIGRETVGLDKLVDGGSYIFAANHPLGGLDGLALVEAIDRKCSGVRIIVNDILMNLDPLKDIFLPINKHGRQTSEYARLLGEYFKSGKAIIYFPAGFCSRKVKGVITDLAWSKNYIQKAIEYKRAIVPVYVCEVNSRFFYNLERFRSKVGIKLNIGMFLLPHELFRRSKRRGGVKMIFGDPISYEELSQTHSVGYWNEEIRKRCYELSKQQ